MAQLQVDVRVQTGFVRSNAARAISGGNFSAAGICFCSGSPGNVVTMRTYLLWPIMTPEVFNMISNASTSTNSDGTGSIGTFLVLSTNESFKNMPDPNVAKTGSRC